MPSAIAHAVVGASLCSALPARARPVWLAVALAALAAAPDLDVIGFRLGIAYEHPLGHRGLSHSLIFASLVALALWPLCQRLAPGGGTLVAVLAFFAIASHGLLDLFTDAGLGIGLFIPLDDTRYFAPWRPIRTSPLSVAAFVSPRGLSILANEALWVGLPCLFLVSALRVVRAIAGVMRR